MCTRKRWRYVTVYLLLAVSFCAVVYCAIYFVADEERINNRRVSDWVTRLESYDRLESSEAEGVFRERLANADADKRAHAASVLWRSQFLDIETAGLIIVLASDDSPSVRQAATDSLDLIIKLRRYVAIRDEFFFRFCGEIVRQNGQAGFPRLRRLFRSFVDNEPDLVEHVRNRLEAASEPQQQCDYLFIVQSLGARASDCAPLVERLRSSPNRDVATAAERALATISEPIADEADRGR